MSDTSKAGLTRERNFRTSQSLYLQCGHTAEVMVLTILWHDEEAGGCTDHINSEWFASEGSNDEVIHLVTGPCPGIAKCNISVSGAFAECDYTPYEEFNKKQGMVLGVMRIQFADSSRKSVKQVLWKGLRKEHFTPCQTTAKFTAPVPSELDRLVLQSAMLSAEERRKRLAGASPKPARTLVKSNTFQRNPDVIAEVLCRAGGVCEVCQKPAPFNRASDGTPYLEVHHIIPLANDGDDTVGNALALCPNCHRMAHYG